MSNLDTRSPDKQRTDPDKKYVWVNSLRLHRTPFQVLESLVRRCGYEQGLYRYQIQVSRSQLERDLHMSRTAVRDCLKYLELRGLIRKIQRPDYGKRYDTNLYVVGVGLVLPQPLSKEDYSHWIAQGRPWKVDRSNLDQPTAAMYIAEQGLEPEVDRSNLDQPIDPKWRTSTNQVANLDQHSIGSQSESNELPPGDVSRSSTQSSTADADAREALVDVNPARRLPDDPEDDPDRRDGEWAWVSDGEVRLCEEYRQHLAVSVWNRAVKTYLHDCGWYAVTVVHVAKGIFAETNDFEATANRMLADAMRERPSTLSRKVH